MYMNWQGPASRTAGTPELRKEQRLARGRRHYRDYDRPSGLIQLGKLFLAAVILLALGAGGLAYYGSTLTPVRHKVEKVLPDDRFPR
jgi:hypothetical protein